MKNHKKNLLFSLLLLVMTLSIVSTSTFAWFSMTAEPTVEDFEMNVTTLEGMQIAVSAVGGTVETSDFSYMISNDAIKTALGDSSYDKIELNAVTPADRADLGDFESDLNGTASTGGYLAFDVHFLSETAMNVFIGNATNATSTVGGLTVMAPVAATNYYVNGEEGTISESFAKGDSIDSNAANAVRIGVKGSSSKIYNPADTATKAIGWSGITESINMAEEYHKYATGDASLSYDDITSDLLKGYDYGTDNFLTLAEDSTSALKDFFGDHTAYYGKATVYVWLEGNDADCFDPIFGDSLSISLDFFGNN